jgi:hypothetical protein
MRLKTALVITASPTPSDHPPCARYSVTRAWVGEPGFFFGEGFFFRVSRDPGMLRRNRQSRPKPESLHNSRKSVIDLPTDPR